MQWESEIAKQLADPTSRVLCLDPTGGRTVALPEPLARFADQIHAPSGVLDVFPPAVRGQVVKAFGLCRIRGTASIYTPVRSGEHRQFDFFNEVEDLGCYIVTMGPPAPVDLDPATSNNDAEELPVRAASWHLDVAGNIVDAHVDLVRMLGWERDELIGRSSLDFTHPDDHEKGILGWIELLEHGLGARSRMRQRFLTKGGSWRWLEDTTTNLLDDPSVGAVTCDLIDISDEMAALEEAERRDALLTRLTEALPTGVLHISPERLPIFWNQRWMELLSGASPSVEGLLEQLAERDQVAQAIDRSFSAGADADIDVTVLGNTKVQFGRLHLRALQRSDGPAEVLITIEDTTSSRQHQQDLHELAHRDSLTGLLGNLGARALIDDQLLEVSDGALLFVDLDSFKPINDTHGHATGDAVLRAVGEAITDAVRQKDTVARIGGDEFIVAIPGPCSPDQVQDVVDRIHSALRSAEISVDRPVKITASVGVAGVRPGDNFDSLLQRADQAMYEVKRAKKPLGTPMSWR